MKKKFLRPIWLTAALMIPLCCLLLVLPSQEPSPVNASDNLESPSSAVLPISAENKTVSADTVSSDTEEMRGVWIPYMSLELAESERSERAFRQKIDTMLNTCLQYHLNTVIVQVRPFGDAIYPSSYYPWSHIISGTQGEGADYDPLDIIVRAAHHRHLAVHAWINPFRISTGQTPPTLSADNPYQQWHTDSDPDNDDYTFTYDGGLYYNPAYPAVRKLIIDGVREIVSRYPVDGIQIDDYFYPSEAEGYDRQSYADYCGRIKNGSQPLTLSEWRKNNVNMLLAGMYRAIHQARTGVVFGIAPQCNFDNNEKMSADVLRWCRENGYMDYLCPQLYVSMNHPIFPFPSLTDRWRETLSNRSVKFYGGLSLYKIGTEADSGTWLSDPNTLAEEIAYLRQHNADGFMLYAYDYLSKIDPIPYSEQPKTGTM